MGKSADAFIMVTGVALFGEYNIKDDKQFSIKI